MCGIIGAIGLNKLRAVDRYSIKRILIEHMFILSSFRGLDSTGWFSVDKNNKLTTDKRAINPWDYLNTLYWDNKARANIYDSNIFVGHTRKATIGGINLATAHPFEEEFVTGVHNGTLVNWKKLTQLHSISDSHALIQGLNETNTEDIPDFLSKVEGAYTIVWYDKVEETLYLARNKERPLWLAYTEEGAVLFASEKQNITFSAERLGVIITEYKELPVGVLYSVALKDVKDNIEFTETKFKVYEAQPVKYVNNYWWKKNKQEDSDSHFFDTTTKEEEEIFDKYKIVLGKSFGFSYNEFKPFIENNRTGFGTVYGTIFNKISKEKKQQLRLVINGMSLSGLMEMIQRKFNVKDVKEEDINNYIFSAKPGFAFYNNDGVATIVAYSNTLQIVSTRNPEKNNEVQNESKIH